MSQIFKHKRNREEMKIIFEITPLIDRPITGVGKVLENLIAEFEHRSDIDSTYFTITARGHLPQLKKKFSNLKAPSIPARVSSPLARIIQYLGVPINLFTGSADAAISAGGLCLPLRQGITVAILYDMLPITNPEWDTKLNTQLFLRYLKSLERHADLVIADSLTAKKDILSYSEIASEKVVVAYPGVSQAFNKKPNQMQRERVRKKYHLPHSFLLFVGAAVPRKNLECLIQAYSKLDQETTKQAKLVFVGGKGWGKKNRFPSFVREIGPVPDEELPSFYWLADALVYPSFKEGFGLPILEAFATETPVLTSNTSGMAEIAKGAAILVDPYSVDDIARGLNRLFTLESKIKREMIEEGKRRLVKFSFPKMADTIVEEISKKKRELRL